MSELLLAGAATADAASSWGKCEANPLLRTGSRFSYGSLAIKLGALGSGLVAQHYLVHRSPGSTKWLAPANLASAAMLGLAARHNMTVPAAK